LQLTLKTTC